MQQHYQQVTNNYHDAPFYIKNSAFERWQFAIICLLLNLHNGSKNDVLDLGAGTGRIAQLLIDQLGSGTKVVCVDPSRAMLEQAKNIAGINTVVSNAVDYVNNNSAQTFDGIILKEMIHHISDKNLEAFFAKLLHLLKPHGTCVICTRPQRGIEYPFFADAIKKWPESQPDPAIYVSLLRKAGFKNIDIAHETYKMQISLDEWVRFIKNRLWSNFSHAQFSDAALNKGIEEILHKYGKTNTIEFNEKQIFIQARKR